MDFPWKKYCCFLQGPSGGGWRSCHSSARIHILQIYNIQFDILWLLWGKENFGRKSHKYEVCVRSRFLTSPSWHLTVRPPTPWFLDYLQIKFFIIQCSCCNFSFYFYPHLWRKKLWKFEAMSLETNCDKLFVKIWSNIAPDISGRGAACYCHFQAPGENKNIASHSRHLR